MDAPAERPSPKGVTRRDKDKLRIYARRYDAKPKRLFRSVFRRLPTEVRAALKLHSALKRSRRVESASEFDAYVWGLTVLITRGGYSKTWAVGCPNHLIALLEHQKWFVCAWRTESLAAAGVSEEPAPEHLKSLVKALSPVWDNTSEMLFCLSIPPLWWCWFGLSRTPGHFIVHGDRLLTADRSPSRSFLGWVQSFVKKCESRKRTRHVRSSVVVAGKKVESGILPDLLKVVQLGSKSDRRA